VGPNLVGRMALVLSGVQPRGAPQSEPLKAELGTHLKAERWLKER
jgi:hypothetical protein